MKYLLDTNVLSELRRKEKTDRAVAAWASQVQSFDLYLSSITILEIELGTLQIMRRDPAQAEHLRRWMDERVLPAFAGRILPVDTAVAQKCAALHVPNLRPERDALIAATALLHGLRVVTRNVADFAPMGVATLNPWTPTN